MEKGLLTQLGEVIDRYSAERQSRQRLQPVDTQVRVPPRHFARILSLFLPNFGTLILVAVLLMVNNVGALSFFAPNTATQSTGTIAYQGRLADAGGSPITATVNMIFRLYAGVSGGLPLWEEQWTGSNSVQVSDGLFNVMLGSLTPIPQNVITGNANLFLGITVGTDSEMSPRVQLGSVPFATQALTVPDGSITTAKIADGAITPTKLSGSLGQVAQDNQPSQTYVTGTTAFQDKATVNLTTKGGPVLVLASFSHVAVGSQHSPMQIRIAVDDVEKKNSGNQYNVAWTNGALTWIETGLQPGAHTFKLQYAITNTADQAHIEHATLTVIELGL